MCSFKLPWFDWNDLILDVLDRLDKPTDIIYTVPKKIQLNVPVMKGRKWYSYKK